MKRIFLIDAVEWGPPAASDAAPGLRDVGHWFRQHLDPPASITTAAASGLHESQLKECDGVIISGSPRDAWADDDFTRRLLGLVQVIRERQVPCLGVCYGHQLLARALGATVGRDPNGFELGNSWVELTPAGRQSKLFSGLDGRLDVLQSHGDAALDLPPGADLLARGEHTAIQSFAWNDLLFGVQFHPETSPEILRYIWEPRIPKWKDRLNFDLVERLDSFRPTPSAPHVLKNFVQHIVTA